MEDKKIPILGIDSQSSEVFNTVDGTCISIENLKPTGKIESPNWEINTERSLVDFSISTSGFDYLKVLSVYLYNDVWHVIVENQKHSISEAVPYIRIYTILNGDFDALLFEEEYSGYNDYDFKWIEASGKLYIHFVPLSELVFPYVFYLDTTLNRLYPWVTPPMIYPFEIQINKTSITLSEFEEYYSDGSYPGFLTNKDKYVSVIYALRIRDGVYIKHSQPSIHKIPLFAKDSTNIEYATLEFVRNANYDNNTTNYEGVLSLFDQHMFPYTDDSLTLARTFKGTIYSPVDQQNDSVCAFISRPMSSYENALNEGTHYLIGTMDKLQSNATTYFEFNENEETIPTNPTLNIDPFSHHVTLPIHIGEYRNNISLAGTVTNFALPSYEFVTENDFYIKGETPPSLTLNDDCIIEVQIDVSGTTYIRRNKISLGYTTAASISLVRIPDQISYPDRRAFSVKIYWYDTSNSQYDLVLDATLNSHPLLNLAINYDNNRSIVQSADGSGDIISLPLTVNDEYCFENSKVRFSDLTHRYLPLERTYDLKEEVLGIVDNLDEVGAGQFGDYPLYILTKSKIFGGRSSTTSFISKIELLSSTHGVNGPKAFTIYKNALWFASDIGIHRMSGSQIEDLFYSVDKANIYSIYRGLIGDENETLSPASLSGISNLITSGNVEIESNPKTDEIIFAKPNTFRGAWVFNIRYKKWYQMTVQNDGYFGESFSPLKIANRLYMLGDKGGYESSSLNFYPRFLRYWDTGEDTGSFSLFTNPIVLDDYSSMKSLRRSILEGYFSLNANSELKIVLQGKRTTHNNWVTLIRYTENTAKDFNSKYLKTNYGSFQAFRLMIQGTDINEGSYISGIIFRYRRKSRNMVK